MVREIESDYRYDNDGYEHLEIKGQRNTGGNVRNNESLNVENVAGGDKQGCCRKPPWWAWALLVIGLMIIAGVATMLAFQFSPPSAKSSATAPIAADCESLYKAGVTTSGVYTISPDGERRMTVYCEQSLNGGGWTVFQRRVNGTVDFRRNWSVYKHGFGDPGLEFWLGNDNIHVLTFKRGLKLKIEMVHPDGRLAYADYSVFYIENEYQKYRVNVTGYLGNTLPGDDMKRCNGQAFSTYDVDNDVYAGHCAVLYNGGWWYDNCHEANLNGLYDNKEYGKGINWRTFTGYYTSLTSVRMMVK